MRRLIVHHAAALRGIELLAPARAIEEVGVVGRRDHRNSPTAPQAMISRAVHDRQRRSCGCGRRSARTPARARRLRSSRGNPPASAPSAFRRGRACRARRRPRRWRDGTDAASRCRRPPRSGSAHISSTVASARALKSARNASRASGRGSAPATISSFVAGKRRQHDAERPAEPRDADPELRVRSCWPYQLDHDVAGARARHADHDVRRLLVLGQHQVAVVDVAGDELGLARAAGAALAAERHVVTGRAQRFQDRWCRPARRRERRST